MTRREREISDLFAEASDRLGLWRRSSMEKSRTVLRDLEHMTGQGMPPSQ